MLGTRTADITMEQELSRPYVYICHRFAPTGFWIVSIKDPAKPRIIYDWKIENAELGRGSGALGPMYAKSKGRYYFLQSFQFGEGGPHRELGAVVFDVTGLPDTTKIKEVARITDPQHPGGFHENFTYKHSSGLALMITDVTGAPMAHVYDIDQVVASGGKEGLVGDVPLPADQAMATAPRAPAAAPAPGGAAAPVRIGGYHDMYVGFDPVTQTDRFYGAGAGGYYVYDITDLKNPKLLTSITGVAGVTFGHTFMAEPTGRYVWTETEYQYAPLRVFDLKPGLDGTTKNISRPIGAWTADWRDLSHNFEIRWPYVFVSAYEDGLQVVNMMDPTNPYTVGYYYTCGCPHNQDARYGVMNGAWGVQVRNADGLIVVSDIQTGMWSLKMEGFDGWNGHQWGMPNVSSAQDWDNGPDGAPKPQRVSVR
jgi:hypothetical protein